MKVERAYFYWRVYRCYTSGYETWLKRNRQDKFSWPSKRRARNIFTEGRTWSNPAVGTMGERRRNVIKRIRTKAFTR